MCFFSEIVEFFFVDTNPFVEKYFTDPEELEKHTYDWRGVLPRETYTAELLKVSYNLQIQSCCYDKEELMCYGVEKTIQIETCDSVLNKENC